MSNLLTYYAGKSSAANLFANLFREFPPEHDLEPGSSHELLEILCANLDGSRPYVLMAYCGLFTQGAEVLLRKHHKNLPKEIPSYERQSVAEIAQSLGIAKSRVYQVLHSALYNLRHARHRRQPQLPSAADEIRDLYEPIKPAE